MSGFLAARADGALSPHDLAQVAGAMAHRGDLSWWSDDGIVLAGFAGRRGSGLAVADDLVVAADARIDDAPGIPDASSDAQRLLLAWRRWGAGALDRLTGDFAGAVWDRRSRRLTIVRDSVGARPALLARAGNRVLAGSGLAALLEDPTVDRSIDEAWVAAFLASVADYATRTGYRGVARLEPGTIAEVEARGWRIRRWYRFPSGRIRERDDEAYAGRFRELLEEAVRCRIADARRPGVMLSGGLDSTSVLMTARSVRPQADLVGISMAFTDPAADERSLQRLVAEAAGARVRWISLDGWSPWGQGVDATLDVHGVPSPPPNRFHAEAGAQAAAAEGVDVMLDGIDGDGVVGGNFYYLSDLLARGRWAAWRRETRSIIALHGSDRRTLLRRYTLMPLLPPSMRPMLKRAPVVPGFVDPAFARRTRMTRVIERDRYRPGATFRASERLVAGPWITPLVLELLDEEWSRRGIEVAHPFLDRRLIEFCLRLPREQKVRHGLTKVVLRGAMRGLLPAAVAERSDKAELSSAFFAGLQGSGWVELSEGLSLASSKHSAWFTRSRLEQLSAAVAGGNASKTDLFEAYRIASVAWWIRRLEEPARREPYRPAVVGRDE